MYSPALARLMQRDAKWYIDGMNVYAYVKNNLLKYLDAYGTTANIRLVLSNSLPNATTHEVTSGIKLNVNSIPSRPFVHTRVGIGETFKETILIESNIREFINDLFKDK